jgi:hypothetical protein
MASMIIVSFGYQGREIFAPDQGYRFRHPQSLDWANQLSAAK